MRVTAVETVRLQGHPEYLWVRVETDDGLIGSGETMPRPDAVEQVVHRVLAPMLVGRDVAPAALWQEAFQTIAYHGFGGAEMRALSAIDIALWDLLGQAAGLPVHRLLGGPCRDRVPVYNTCVTHGAHRDRERFLNDPGGLARELLDEGYRGMKIWPFDELSRATLGQRIDRAALTGACRVIGAIRDAVGLDIEVAIEGHSCWTLPAAVSIARAVEEFRPMWLEDMLHAGDPAAWRRLREATSTPMCGSERLFTRWAVAPFLDAGALDIVNQDLCWTGGFTELMRVAALAGARELPLAPHNCHGPIGSAATMHASVAIPNLYLTETVRSFAAGFFADLVDAPFLVREGAVTAPDRPGLGVALRADVLSRATRLRTTASDSYTVGFGAGDPWSGDLGDRV